MKTKILKYKTLWEVWYSDCFIGYWPTPKEAKQKTRQWHLYMTAPTDEMVQKYLNGEIVVK